MFRICRIALPLCRSDAEPAHLAAGALERMLGKHGERMIGRVEAEARRDPAFMASAAGGLAARHVQRRYGSACLVASGRTPPRTR